MEPNITVKLEYRLYYLWVSHVFTIRYIQVLRCARSLAEFICLYVQYGIMKMFCLVYVTSC